MTRRELLRWAAASGASAAALRFLPAAGAARTAIEGASLRWLCFGDWGSGFSLQKNVARAMSDYCRGAPTPVDFAVSTGDNFYDDGVSSASDAQWQTKFEAMYPVATMPFPFFAVLGNHDWRSDPNAQLVYGANSETRWNMDGFYYARSMGAWNGAPLADFFFFDTDLWLPQYRSQGLGERQQRWLQNALKQSRARWKFLVGHHPPFSDGAEGSVPIVRDVLLPLCRRYRVDTLFSGHDHDMQRISVAPLATHFLICGAGGASLRARKTRDFGPFYLGKVGGFLSLELSANALRGQFRDVQNQVRHEWTQTPLTDAQP